MVLCGAVFSSPRRKGHYGSATNAPEAVLKEFLTEDAKGHSDYLSALDAWQSRFPGNRMMVGYFDELASDPRAFYVRVLDFLGIDVGPSLIPPAVDENRHASRGSKPPHEYRVFLARLYSRPGEGASRQASSGVDRALARGSHRTGGRERPHSRAVRNGAPRFQFTLTPRTAAARRASASPSGGPARRGAHGCASSRCGPSPPSRCPSRSIP